MAFEEHFNSHTNDFWPVLDESGNLKPSKLKTWVKKHLRYTLIPFTNNDKKVVLTVKDVRFLTSEIIEKEGQKSLRFEYEASCDGIRQIIASNDSDHLNISPLKKGDTFSLPENISRVYLTLFELKDFYKEGLKKIEIGEISLLKDQVASFLKKTSTASFSNICYEKRGKFISPQNFFSFFDESLASCDSSKLRFSPLKIISVEEKKINEQIYPEYHRLFADNKLEMFSYFNQVGEEAPRHVETLLKNLVRDHYEFVNGPGFSDDNYMDKGIYLLRKKVFPRGGGAPLELEMTIVLAEKAEKAEALLSKAIREAEVISYDGHAGYGANINSYFKRPEKYPKEKYQVILLNGCKTYFYGVSEVLSAKALADMDFLGLNIDLISTYDNSYMSWRMKFDLLKTFEVAAYNFRSHESSWPLSHKKYINWSSIIKRFNKIDRANAKYLVSGEQHNHYSPGMQKFTPSATGERNKKGLKEALKKSTYSVEQKKKFFNYLVQITPQGMTEFAELKKELLGLCHEFKDIISEEVSRDVFWASNCALKNITLTDDMIIQGVSITKGAKVSFYKKGALNIIISPSDIQVDPFLLEKENVISFYPNGQLMSGRLAKAAQIKTDIIGKSGEFIRFHNNGEVSSVMLKTPFRYKEFVFSQDTILSFYENGMILNGKIKKGQVHNIIVEGLTKINFLTTGELSKNIKLKGVLAQDEKRDGHALKKGTWIETGFTGKIEKGKMIAPFHFLGIVFPSGSEISFRKTYRSEYRVCVPHKMKIGSYEFAQSYSEHSDSSNCLYLYENGRISEGRFEAPTIVEGIEYSEKKTTSFYPNGKIKLGTPTKAIEINGLVLQKGMPISFYEKGSLKWVRLASPTKIGDFLFSTKSLNFHENGNVYAGYLENGGSYKNLKLKKRSFIRFHDNGVVAELSLSEDSYIQGIEFAKSGNSYRETSFYKNGNLRQGYLAKEQIIEGVKIKKGSLITLSESGYLKNSSWGTILENGPLFDSFSSKCYKDEGLTFLGEKNNMVLSCVLKENIVFDGIPVLKEYDFTRYPNGKMMFGFLSRDFTLGGYTWERHFEIEFYDNEQVKSGHLKTPAQIGTLGVFKGDVSFFKSGSLKKEFFMRTSPLMENFIRPENRLRLIKRERWFLTRNIKVDVQQGKD